MRVWCWAFGFLCFTLANARNQAWDAMFDVPSGFRSYQTQRAVGHRPTLDDMSLGFEGFLDEGIDAETPDQVPVKAIVPKHHKHLAQQSHHHGHDHPHSTHQRTHKHQHHHRRHHSNKPVSFLEIATQYVDPALAEAERDSQLNLASSSSVAPPNVPPQPQAPQAVADDLPQDRIEAVTRPLQSEKKSEPKSEALAFDLAHTDVDSLLSDQGGFEIHNVDELRASLAQLEDYIRNRGPKQPTLTETLTSATQAQAMDAAEALKSVGSGTTNGQAFLELSEASRPGIGNDYRAPPAFPARPANVKGGNYASGPSYPQTPSHPEGELDWTLDSMNAKGYGGEPPKKLSLDQALQSFKGFIKKGTQFMSKNAAAPTPKDMKETPSDGFGGWPQPFWWTKPPAWVDEVPGWMQRLQMKKSQSMHKYAAFG